MGLDCSHDAFHGAYSAFNRLRQAVAKAAGGSYPPHDDPKLSPSDWYWDDKYTVTTHPGLYAFLVHSDCDGEIQPDVCAMVACDLEPLLPAIAAQGSGGGHLENQGGYGAVLQKFIDGCKRAHECGEALVFA
jgi:hypothetical protein